ncbi:MAG: 30S ribosomal protein S6 [Caldisericaceae bacterium]
MAYYEMLYIVSQELPDEDKEKLIEKLKDFVEKSGGAIASESRWGTRGLAYPIKKQDKGYYVLTYLDLPEKALKELKYFVKVNEGFLRAMILKKEKPEPEIAEEEAVVVKEEVNE